MRTVQRFIGAVAVTATLAFASGLLSGATPVAPSVDFSGTWQALKPQAQLRTTDGKAPLLTADGAKRYAGNQAKGAEDPISRCLPPGIPRSLQQPGFPFSLVQGETMIGMIVEWNHLPRVIYMNRDHFENIGPEYLGQSIGHWEGTTLVVDTNGYNDMTWLDDSGLPHTEDLHTVERIRLLNANTLEDRITITDAATFKQPWTTVLTFTRQPGRLIKEDYCLGRLGLGVTVSK